MNHRCSKNPVAACQLRHKIAPLALAAHLAVAGLAAALIAAPSAHAADAVAAYDIPAGPLNAAIHRFVAQSGVFVAADGALTEGHSSPGLQGRHAPADALERLVAGTGLKSVRQADGSYTLRKADAAAPKPQAATTHDDVVLPAVTVRASAAGAEALRSPQHASVAAGALGARSQLDTPLSTTVVTGDELAQRHVSKLGDVFALDAAVTDNSGAYSSWASYITVRGLELDWQNSYRLDGKPFLSYAITLPYEHFEQVELFKGSSGFLYGFGSPGGLINYVSKKPGDEPTRVVQLGVKSNGIVLGGVDLGGRVGDDKTFGYRLNAVHENGKTFNDGKVRRSSVSLALDARLTPDLVWDLQSLYQRRCTEDQTPSISAAQLNGTVLPDAVRSDNQNLVSGGQFLDTGFGHVATGLRYRIAPQWTASSSLSHSRSERSRNEGILYLRNVAGDYDEFRSDTREAHRFDQWQAMLEGRAQTGGFEHQITFGAAWQKQLNEYSTNGVWTQLGSGNLFSRNGNGYDTQGGLALYRAGEIAQKSVFGSDVVKLSERWSVLAGLRHTRYSQTDFLPDGSLSSGYADGVTTPTVAVMFKPEPATMLYASAMESLEPGHTVGASYANADRLLAPLVSRQLELGLKTERRYWNATAALFRITRPSEYANSANELVQDGLSSYQGLELGAAARVDARWQISGHLMLLDASYDKGSANIGNRVAGAPRRMATLRVAYAVPAANGLELSADAKHTGGVMLNPGNTVEVDAHTLLNLGANYRFRLGDNLATVRASINNAANKRFWEYQYANWIKPADPRTFSLGATLAF